MTRSKLRVPKATMQRYPIYLKALRKIDQNGKERILSKELSQVVDIEPTTIRRDFSFIGSLGKQGYGYDVKKLIEIFENLLGLSFEEKIVLIGVGNLGKAILNYNHWDHVVGEIVCAFDSDPRKIGEINGIEVHDIRDVKKYLPEHCRIAILTIDDHIQDTVDYLIECGIRGFVDFSHEYIKVPDGAFIRSVDVVATVQELIFQVNNM